MTLLVSQLRIPGEAGAMHPPQDQHIRESGFSASCFARNLARVCNVCSRSPTGSACRCERPFRKTSESASSAVLVN